MKGLAGKEKAIFQRGLKSKKLALWPAAQATALYLWMFFFLERPFAKEAAKYLFKYNLNPWFFLASLFITSLFYK